jgi:hypothetical protein
MRKHRKAVSRGILKEIEHQTQKVAVQQIFQDTGICQGNVIADNLSFVFAPGYSAGRRTEDVKVIICDLDMLLFSPSCLL